MHRRKLCLKSLVAELPRDVTSRWLVEFASSLMFSLSDCSLVRNTLQREKARLMPTSDSRTRVFPLILPGHRGCRAGYFLGRSPRMHSILSIDCFTALYAPIMAIAKTTHEILAQYWLASVRTFRRTSRYD
jgi:hypothetical protein